MRAHGTSEHTKLFHGTALSATTQAYPTYLFLSFLVDFNACQVSDQERTRYVNVTANHVPHSEMLNGLDLYPITGDNGVFKKRLADKQICFTR
eukprot:2585843-Amphidinium_carterae.1